MRVTFKDIKADILAKIVEGEWQPGALVPNENDIATDYGCARATVNRAMRELAEEGFIERRRKAGTRVRQSPLRQARFSIPIVKEEIEKQNCEYRYALVTSEVITAPDWIRARLKLSEGDRVLHMICMHYADSSPYQYEDRWINLAILPQAETADFTVVGPNEWLISTIPFSDVDISFFATTADKTLSKHLSCNVGEPLFTTERSTWLKDQAITFARLSFRPGHRMTTRY